MEIFYLKHNKIDKKRWDNSINNAENGLIFGCSWFLDIVCDTWDALVTSNYEYILPLPIKSKFGLNAIHKPPYTQRYNVFGENVSHQISEDFLKNIPKSFFSYSVNLSDNLNPIKNNVTYLEKNTQRLLLNKPYDELFKYFEKNHRRNIKKALKNNVQIKQTDDVKSVVSFKKQVLTSKNIILSNVDYQRLHKIIDYNFSKSGGEIYGAFYEGELIASSFFAKFKNQYTKFSGANSIAKKLGATHLIMNQFIQNHADSGDILDFSGSNIDSIARWNLGFGAKNYSYFEYSKKLPRVLNSLFKLLRK